MQNGVVTTGETAGFPERLVAIIIDVIILAIPNFIIGLILPGQVLDFFVSVAIGVGYAVYFWTSSGQTIGKMIMGLKVVHGESGELLDPGTAVLRYVGYYVSAIPLFLGFLWVLWDPNKEGFHDKIAKTRVVKVR